MGKSGRTTRQRVATLVAALLASFVAACAGTRSMPEAAMGEVTGTVTYRQRIALPPDAVVALTLADSSRQDAPADVLAEAEIPAAGRQVPIPFRIAYPTRRIDPAHTYVVRARILVGGRMTMTSTTITPVLTRGAPGQVEIVVSPVGAPAAPETDPVSGQDSG